MDDAYEDYNDWWDDLTIEQKRAAYFAWLRTDMKTVYYEDIAPKTDTTTHSNLPSTEAVNVKSAPMTDEELQAWLRNQSLRDPSRRYG